MQSIRRCSLVMWGMVLGLLPLHAQVVVPTDSLADSTVTIRGGSAGRITAARVDTASLHATNLKSPGLAMLLSAAVPGAGQFYNGSYWKVPVVFGLGLYFVSSWLDNNRRADDYRKQYDASVLANAPDETLRSIREFYKNQRDAFAWYFMVLYLINIADAYVDASLSGFTVGGDLSIIAPVPQAIHGPPGTQVTIRWSF
jgi:hypothetical protein